MHMFTLLSWFILIYKLLYRKFYALEQNFELTQVLERIEFELKFGQISTIGPM